MLAAMTNADLKKTVTMIAAVEQSITSLLNAAKTVYGNSYEGDGGISSLYRVEYAASYRKWINIQMSNDVKSLSSYADNCIKILNAAK